MTQQSASTTAPVEPTTASPKISAIVDDIAQLNLIEVRDFVALLKERLGISESFGMPAGMAPAASAGGADGAAEPEAEVKEQTAFTVQLKSYDAKTKIKVIKEVRALTKLGLKEAKTLVESAPANVLESLPKAEAETIMAKLKGVGAEVALI